MYLLCMKLYKMIYDYHIERSKWKKDYMPFFTSWICNHVKALPIQIITKFLKSENDTVVLTHNK